VERRARAALLLAAALGACTSESDPSCPGTPLGQFAFTGALGTEVEAGLDPDPDLTTCSFDPAFPTTIRFSATLAHNTAGSAAALCREGTVFFGTRSGESWRVELASGGAVLGACGATCVARARTVVAGVAGPDPAAPVEFQGALVEQLTRDGGDCGACLPCAGRYALTGAREGP
jgi:hypothetical protein